MSQDRTERLIRKERLKLQDLANEKKAVAAQWVARARRIRERITLLSAGVTNEAKV